jgi:hypothetical protein
MISMSGGVYPRRGKPGGSSNLEVILGHALSRGSASRRYTSILTRNA